MYAYEVSGLALHCVYVKSGMDSLGCQSNVVCMYVSQLLYTHVLALVFAT